MSIFSRRRRDDVLVGADHGSNYTAMAEAMNSLYKTERIRRPGPWRTVGQVEVATLEWVRWWKDSRLHGELDMSNSSRSNRGTTLTSNQPTRHLPDKAPDRKENQADSDRTLREWLRS